MRAQPHYNGVELWDAEKHRKPGQTDWAVRVQHYLLCRINEQSVQRQNWGSVKINRQFWHCQGTHTHTTVRKKREREPLLVISRSRSSRPVYPSNSCTVAHGRPYSTKSSSGRRRQCSARPRPVFEFSRSSSTFTLADISSHCADACLQVQHRRDGHWMQFTDSRGQ